MQSTGQNINFPSSLKSDAVLPFPELETLSICKVEYCTH